MSELTCSSCGANRNVEAVCHHCGQPLCSDRQFCRVELNDDLFQGQPRAIHCFPCAEQYHGHRLEEQPNPLDELFAWIAEKLSRFIPG